MNLPSPRFFSKDVSGVEVEAKYHLLTKDPFGFILNLDQRLSRKECGFFSRQFCLGQQDSSIQSWNNKISFFGFGSGDQVFQLFMVGHSKNRSAVFPVLKKYEVFGTAASGNILDRLEAKNISKWMSADEFNLIVKDFEKKFGVEIKLLAEMQRTKVWLYVTNSATYRNFSVSADFCKSLFSGKSMSQVEVEYKGRSGIHLPEGLPPVFNELTALGKVISNKKGILIKTSMTKLQWLLAERKK